MSDEAFNEVTGYLHDLTNNVIMGKFTEEMLDMAYNALHHDEDVADAERVGEVRGRNARINQVTRRPEQTDGVPVLGGAARGGGVGSREPSIFELAKQAQ